MRMAASFMHEHWMGYPGGMGIGMFFMLLLWIIVIVGIVFFVRWAVDQTAARQRGRSEESALDILNKRYARGEIDKKEYEEKKKDLQ